MYLVNLRHSSERKSTVNSWFFFFFFSLSFTSFKNNDLVLWHSPKGTSEVFPFLLFKTVLWWIHGYLTCLRCSNSLLLIFLLLPSLSHLWVVSPLLLLLSPLHKTPVHCDKFLDSRIKDVPSSYISCPTLGSASFLMISCSF